MCVCTIQSRYLSSSEVKAQINLSIQNIHKEMISTLVVCTDGISCKQF